MLAKKILLVREVNIDRKGIENILKGQAFPSYTVLEHYRALQEVRRAKYDLVLIEEEGRGDIGIEILKQIKKSWPDTRVIFVTEYGDMYSYLKAMNLGAYDYLNQSVEWDRLPKIIDKALLQFAA